MLSQKMDMDLSDVKASYGEEMETMGRFIRQDGILPETVKRYMGLDDYRIQDIAEVSLDSSQWYAWKMTWVWEQSLWNN